MVIRPIGPQPVTTAVWPATSSTKAAWTALPSGSWSAAISASSPRRPRRSPRAGPRTAAKAPERERQGCACSGRRGRGRSGTGSTSNRRCASLPRPCRPARSRPAPGAAANDDARHLVAEHHRRRAEVLLCPLVPALDVNVSAANATPPGRERGSRPGPAAGWAPRAWRRPGAAVLLDQCAHGRSNARRGRIERWRRAARSRSAGQASVNRCRAPAWWASRSTVRQM